MKNIVFCHLLNDYSGSPHVLSSVIKGLKNNNDMSLQLYIGSSEQGVLDSAGIVIHKYFYIRHNNRFITFFTYFISQIILFFKLISNSNVNNNSIIYINTLLPFGGAVYGVLTGKKVIYHIHEISVEPKFLRLFLCWINKISSSKNIYVSKIHQKTLSIPKVSSICIYNSLDPSFSARASSLIYKNRRRGLFNILMIASLRDYKGISEFLQLAFLLRDRLDVTFTLLANESLATIDRYFQNKTIGPNLKIYPRTTNLNYFYTRASLLLNLSRTDLCIETFGLTVLEAMAYGVPVIVPPVGGPAEIVIDGIHGYLVDSKNTNLMKDIVLTIADNENISNRISNSARQRASEFNNDVFNSLILKCINEI